jgi:hypothetical protein
MSLIMAAIYGQENNPTKRSGYFLGGETGIRTLGTVARTHAFQACQFNRSCTSPCFFILPKDPDNTSLHPIHIVYGKVENVGPKHPSPERRYVKMCYIDPEEDAWENEGGSHGGQP